MKLTKSIIAGAVMASLAHVAQADVTVYITGATAYRSPLVSAVQAFLDPGYKGVYGVKTGVTSASNASNWTFQGVKAANPSLGTITIKATLGGSVGGIKLIQSTAPFTITDQPGVKGWIPDSYLPGSGVVGTNESSITYDTASLPDAAFSDAFQSSALGGAAGDAVGLNDADGKIGVIPFDFVVSNGVTKSTVTLYSGVTYLAGTTTIPFTSTTGAAPAIGRTIAGTGIPLNTTITVVNANDVTISNATTAANQGNPAATTISSADTAVAPLSNITSNQAYRIMAAGLNLSSFTGVTGSTKVYSYGRNADSGTRVSLLGESYRGILNNPAFQLKPVFTIGDTGDGKGGNPGNPVASLARWPSETVLTVSYGVGASGYNSGGDLANALTAPGSTLATGNAGWIVGYLGRGDSNTACAKTFGQNTAKRLTFNGQQDWVGNGDANKVDGTPTAGYNDDAIRQGAYQGWEYEHFYRKGSLSSGDKFDVLTALAASIVANPTVSNAIQLSTMAASRTVEGGPITRN